MPQEKPLAKVLAIESGVQNTSFKTIKDAHRAVGTTSLISALNETYEKIKDDGEDLPDKPGMVAVRVAEQLANVRRAVSEWTDLRATKEWGNTKAFADLTIGERTIPDVPVLLLVFLNDRLKDLHTMISELPVVDAPVEQWHVDTNDGLHKTDPITTTRTAKVPKVVLLAPATKEHQAQTNLYFDDETIGYFKRIKMSSALMPAERDRLLARVREVQQAVKFARTEANQVMVEEHPISDVVFGHIFG